MSKLYALARRLTSSLWRNKVAFIPALIATPILVFSRQISDLSPSLNVAVFGFIPYCLTREFVDWFFEIPRSDEESK